MQNLIRQAAIVATLLLAACLSSCGGDRYAEYSLTVIQYVPDSLKSKHREFITETVRAASQHMTGGDYEDVDETIYQAERTADRVFSVEVTGLKKRLSEYNWIDIKPNEFNVFEKHLFDSLQNCR